MVSNISVICLPSFSATSEVAEEGVEPVPSVAAQLPQFLSMSSPSFEWNEVDGEVFVQEISSAYNILVHWRCNLFVVPFGRVGKAFVQELARLHAAYGEGSSLECIAIKAAMVMCALLLQKLHRSAKSKDFIACLERRLDLWKQGHMLRGNVKAAINLIDSTERSGAPMKLDTPLDPDSPSWTVYNELLKKHP